METILLSTQNRETRQTICDVLSSDYRIAVANTTNQLWEHIDTLPCECLIIDLSQLEGLSADGDANAAYNANEDPKGLIRNLKSARPLMDIVVLVRTTEIRRAITFMKNGASNYITQPVDAHEVRLVLEEMLRDRRQQSELAYLREQLLQEDGSDIVRTLSPKMKTVYDNVRSVAPTKTTVLLLGETGTGKNFNAKLIHRHSNRKNGPFISVHCGAIPDTLIESELFGHEKGAFTGAHRRKMGKFELASQGTIFLDEIGTISKAAQVKLLTVLQEGIYQRVGGERNLEANVRVIAASNANLKEMCDQGQFRKDLFYRLNVFPIHIPRLHERKEDIPSFANAFLKRFNQFNTKTIRSIHPDVMDALMNYDWPGNIRELENLLERAYILETSYELTPESFPSELFETFEPMTEITVNTTETLAMVREKGLAEIERRYLKELLSRNRGKINQSALEAGVGTRQLNKLMNKYELDKRSFKGSPTR